MSDNVQRQQKALEFIINHVVLPPKLPQGQEDNFAASELVLARWFRQIMEVYCNDKGCSGGNERVSSSWNSALCMLEHWVQLHGHEELNATLLEELLGNMAVGGSICLYLKAQNCCLFIHRGSESSTSFEVFEVSARNQDIITTQGRMKRTFPARVVEITCKRLQDINCRRELAKTLAAVCNKVFHEARPTTLKAGFRVVESRDTVHPKLVTEYVMNVLASFGTTPAVRAISKHIREEVEWNNCNIPWRRSPVWLALKVSLQLHLYRLGMPAAEYKNFMIFWMARIAEQREIKNLSNDILFAINAKIATRLCKLGARTKKTVFNRAKQAAVVLRSCLELHWSNVQLQDRGEIPQVTEDIENTLRIENSLPYIKSALSRDLGPLGSRSFQPLHPVRMHFDPVVLPVWNNCASKSETILHLADIEKWVAENNTQWADDASRSTDDCSQLTALILSYDDCARGAYDGCPREMCGVMLTIADLWMSLDRITTRLLPLLKAYPPEIPLDFFRPLLLPEMSQMMRAQKIEAHLKRRYDECDPKNPRIFDDPSIKSFECRYFDISAPLQALASEIENDAEQIRQRKRTEFEKKERLREALLNHASAMKCDIVKLDWEADEKHDPVCEKCQIVKQANTIEIGFHEWPLPERRKTAQHKTAVFELQPPPSFSSWRDATWYIVHNIGRGSNDIPGRHIHTALMKYEPLAPYIANDRDRRVCIGSQPKPWMVTHYNKNPVLPVPIEDVCVKNALVYRRTYAGRSGSYFTTDQTQPSSTQRFSIQRIPQSSYSSLQWAIDGTSHTSNQVLASQSQCPASLSLPEYFAFASLRAGEQIQWYNILRELACCSLSFNDQAVLVLLQGAAWQAGSPGNGSVRRAAHAALSEDHFCCKLANLLRRKFDQAQSSSKELVAMSGIALLAARLLSLTSSEDVRARAAALLKDIRGATLKWSRDLATETNEQHTGIETGSQKLMLAIECPLLAMSTFDSELRNLLLTDDADVSAYIEAIIRLRDNLPADTRHLSELTRWRLIRVQKIAHSLEHKVSSFVLKSSMGINEAIAKIWNGARFDDLWKTTARAAVPWVVNSTTPCTGQASIEVHLNLLTGELLAGGRSVARLPEEYKQDSLFRDIFGKTSFQVVASNLSGMAYMTTNTIGKYHIHFGNNHGNVTLRLARDGNIYELLSPKFFEVDFPTWFSREFFPLLDLTQQRVEFRSRENLWDDTSSIWTLELSPSPCMRLGARTLLDRNELASSQVIGVLSRLEEPRHIHVTISDDGILEASIHRLGLTFRVNSSRKLECVELKATVDDDQTIGCLVGLKSKLVLVHNDTVLKRRSVLVPFGEAHMTSVDDHVEIALQDLEGLEPRKRRYIRFQVDEDLQRLKDTSALYASLFLAYLHAITSFVLADPFTGRTGTEEALDRLREPRLRQSLPLDEDELRVLKWISKLTPRRSYYPAHTKVMQTTEWHPQLSALVQHEDFSMLANEIVQNNKRYSMFSDKSAPSLENCWGEENLHLRSKIRLSSFRNSTVANLEDPSGYDCKYKGRDTYESNEASQRVFSFCSAVLEWRPAFQEPKSLDFVRNWSSVKGYGSSSNVDSVINLIPTDLRHHWGALYDTMRQCRRETDLYRTMFILGATAYQRAENLSMSKVLLEIAISEDFKAAPYNGEFRLSKGTTFNKEQLGDILKRYKNPLAQRSFRRFSQHQHAHQQLEYNNKLNNEMKLVIEDLEKQWPTIEPTRPDLELSVVNLSDAMPHIRTAFMDWHHNQLYLQHINEAEQLLQRHEAVVCINNALPDSLEISVEPLLQSKSSHLSLTDLLARRDPPRIKSAPVQLEFHRSSESQSHNEKSVELCEILQCLRSKDVGQKFLDTIHASIAAYEESPSPTVPSHFPTSVEEVGDYVEQTRQHVRHAFEALEENLRAGSSSDRRSIDILRIAGLDPTISPQTLLKMLSREMRKLSSRWMKAITGPAEAMADHQRAKRLYTLFCKGDILSFFKEAENPGRRGWHATQFPDWLLLEIENDLGIRQIQATIAISMILEPNNAVFQLNMGEGKSSVIIPMIAAAAADGSKLLRVLVLRPLFNQAYSLLTERLGRLVGRQIYSMPFTRQARVNASVPESIRRLCAECMESGGVLLTLPEDILSFRLMSFERMRGDFKLAKELIKVNLWLQKNCKDVLDESDEILSVKFQHIYAVGAQAPVHGSPGRWLISIAILSLVREVTATLAQDHPALIDTNITDARFPLLRFTNQKGLDLLLELVLNRVIQDGLPQISITSSSGAVRKALLEFISNSNVSREVVDIVTKSFDGTLKMDFVLLLRGLFADGILRHALRRRWYVDNGLDLSRCMMAVPYHAKGHPSPRSEFSHPDLAILLTILSYYYSGLEPEHLRQALTLIHRETNPADEYYSWCRKDPGIPERLKTLMAVDLLDEKLCNELFPRLRYNIGAVNFFLCKVVFPLEAIEFQSKLTTSAWDIPAIAGNHATTGFSGTNDNRRLLPSSIIQKDVPGLESTTAMVLSTILQERNREYTCARDPSGRNLSSDAFLSLLSEEKDDIQVLIDVGAQILDLTNFEVAKTWLAKTKATAAIYFDDNHVAQVVDRQGAIQKLSTSVFQNHLDDCLIYLDEAHTRGININLPDKYRAAVYLGPETTKDKLAQACMRMRKLEHSQSVKFFASLDVDIQISELLAPSQSRIDSADVIKWCALQTDRLAKRLEPLWFHHRDSYTRQQQACTEFEPTLSETSSSSSDNMEKWYNTLLEREARTLSEMYYPHLQGSGLNQQIPVAEEQEREREREVEVEIEREKQVERPPRKEPLQHEVSEEVRYFATNGSIRSHSTRFIIPAFEVFRNTSIRQHVFDASHFPKVYVTNDFAQSVPLGNRQVSDKFLRPVQWIISSNVSPDLLVISPFEANELVPVLRRSKCTALHIYAPKTSKSMLSFSDLQFCVVSASATKLQPPRLSTLILDLFSGTTYLDSVEKYRELCTFLGVASKALDDDNVCPDTEGFLNESQRRQLGWPGWCPFKKTPIPFIRRLLLLRSNYDDHSMTHMGSLVNGNVVEADSFET